jgi:hypothetical protein
MGEADDRAENQIVATRRTELKSGGEENVNDVLVTCARAGFGDVRVVGASKYTAVVHTRKLDENEEEDFAEWVTPKEHVTALDGDFLGDLYRWEVQDSR